MVSKVQVRFVSVKALIPEILSQGFHCQSGARDAPARKDRKAFYCMSEGTLLGIKFNTNTGKELESLCRKLVSSQKEYNNILMSTCWSLYGHLRGSVRERFSVGRAEASERGQPHLQDL